MYAEEGGGAEAAEAEEAGKDFIEDNREAGPGEGGGGRGEGVEEL